MDFFLAVDKVREYDIIQLNKGEIMQKDYIYQLYKQNKIIELEREFENTYSPEIKVVVYMASSQRELNIIITDRTFKLIIAYKATDFDCKPVKEDCLHFLYQDMPKSEKCCDDADVRKFYLRFMKRNFTTFIEDFKTQLMEQANSDLGETVS